MNKNTSWFEGVIGQDEPKKKLGFYLNSYMHTRIYRNLCLCGPKGDGKTRLAREVGKQLLAFGEDGKPLLKEDGRTLKKKTFLEYNVADIKSLSKFVNGVIIPKVVERDVTVFIDEAHVLRQDVITGMLSMLETNEQNRTNYVHDDIACPLDFRRQTFILATSESHSLFPPLMDRLTRIDLQAYTCEDLAKIIAISAPEVSFQDGVLENMATVVRSNARQAVKMASDVRTYLCNKTKFGRKEWRDLSKILSIKPLGLSPIEINLLRFMQERPDGSSLTNLAARSKLSREAVQKDYESYLQNHGLMEITAGKGRQLTGAGQQYLKDLAVYNANLV